MTNSVTPTRQPDGGFAPSAEERRILQAVLETLRRIRYGSVQLLVQDGRVIQIDTLEKQRFSHQDDVAV